MNQDDHLNELRQTWTDQYVTVSSDQSMLRRFAGKTGRVVTVNGSMKCIVDFQDGGWYDIAPEYLTRCSDQAASSKMYQSRKNSAQRLPVRQA